MGARYDQIITHKQHSSSLSHLVFKLQTTFLLQSVPKYPNPNILITLQLNFQLTAIANL